MPKGVYIRTPEIKERMRGTFKKGLVPWNKGLKGIHMSPETEFKSGHSYGRRFKEKETSGELNNNWKGDEVGYMALHSWVRRNLGKPSLCEHCHTTEAKRFEWASVNHTYTRVKSDWIRLCPTCHKAYDRALRALAV